MNFKSLFINIKNIIPYLTLIAIYFIFINIEAQKNQSIKLNNNRDIEKTNQNIKKKSVIKEHTLIIPIPVIPYSQ